MFNGERKSDWPAMFGMFSLLLLPTFVGGTGGYFLSREVLDNEFFDPIDALDPILIVAAVIVGVWAANKATEKVIETF